MEPTAPRLSQTLALVAEVVGVPQVSPQDNFFDLGGDSLTAAFLSLLLDERLGAPVDVFTIYSADDLETIHQAVIDAVCQAGAAA
ncbi:acyl carrier protein [Streptomyces sp. NPDC020800]|uniref:acyl carrier protein n=1 Tax=Streptomyces sp. NPDC020800 TaxID=3365092 RepID=UPI0037B8F3BA